MPAFREENAINLIAAQEASIDGVKASFGYAQNPDSLNNVLPAVIHFIPSFGATPRAFPNVWANSMTFNSVLFVLPRESAGGKLRYIENAAIPFGQKWREKFQDTTVITNLLSQLGGVKVFLTGGQYGVGNGNNLLTFAGTDMIGWIFQFECISA